MQSAAAAAPAMAPRTKFQEPAGGLSHVLESSSRPSSSSAGSSSLAKPPPVPPTPRISSDPVHHHHPTHPPNLHHHHSHAHAHHLPPYAMRPLSFHRQTSGDKPTHKFSLPSGGQGNTIYSPRQTSESRSTTQITHPRRSFMSSSSSATAIPFSKVHPNNDHTSQSSQQHHHYPYQHPSQQQFSQHPTSHHQHHPPPRHQEHDSYQHQSHNQHLTHATTARALGFALPSKAMLSAHSHSDLPTPAWALAKPGEMTYEQGDQLNGAQQDDIMDGNYSGKHPDDEEDEDISDSLSSDGVDPQDTGTASKRKRKRGLTSNDHPQSIPEKSVIPSSFQTSVASPAGSSKDETEDGVSKDVKDTSFSRFKEGKRTRVPQACDLCRRRKARCLNGRPIGAQNPSDPGAKCDRCTKQNAECVWSFFSDAGRQATAARKKAVFQNDAEASEGAVGDGSRRRSNSGALTPHSSQEDFLGDGCHSSGTSRSPMKVKTSVSKRATKRRRKSVASPARQSRRKTLDMAARAEETKNEGLFEQTTEPESQGTQGISDALAGALDLHPDSQRPQAIIMELGVPSSSMSPSIPTPRQIISDGMPGRSGSIASADGSSKRTMPPPPGQTAGTAPIVLPSQRWRDDILAHLNPAIQRRLRRLRRKSESALRDYYAEEGRKASNPTNEAAPQGSASNVAHTTTRGRPKRRCRRNTIAVPAISDDCALTYVEGVYLSPTLSRAEARPERQSSPEASDVDADHGMELAVDESLAQLPTRPYLDWPVESKLDWLDSACPLLSESPATRRETDVTAPAVMGLIDMVVPSQDANFEVGPAHHRLGRVVNLMDRTYSEIDGQHITSAMALDHPMPAYSMFSSQASIGTTADRPPTDSQINEVFDLADAGMASQPTYSQTSYSQQSQSVPPSQQQPMSFKYSQSQQGHRGRPLHTQGMYSQAPGTSSMAQSQRMFHSHASQQQQPLSQTSVQGLPLNLTQEYHSPHNYGHTSSKLGRAAPFGRVISFGQSQWGSGIMGGLESEFESNGGAGGVSFPASQTAMIVDMNQQQGLSSERSGGAEDERMMQLSQSDGEGE